MGMDIRDMGCSDQCVLVLLSLVDPTSLLVCRVPVFESLVLKLE